MKKLLILAVLVGLSVVAFQRAMRADVDKTSRQRVGNMLELLAQGNLADREAALRLWSGLGPSSDMASLRKLSDRFEAFLSERSVGTIDRYSIERVSVSKGSRGLTGHVECKINGTALSLEVRKREPLSWAD